MPVIGFLGSSSAAEGVRSSSILASYEGDHGVLCFVRDRVRKTQDRRAAATFRS
jgi:hypothetical protein